MPETTPLIKAALNLRVGAGFDVYDFIRKRGLNSLLRASNINHMFEDLTSWGKRFMEEQINND